MLRCIFGPNLVILAWTADELWGGQAQNEVKLDFQVKFDLEGQGRSSPKTIGSLTKVFCTFVPNLVILAWTSGELSCGQARDWHTHTHGHTNSRTHKQTDAGNDNARRPKLASGKKTTNMWMFYFSRIKLPFSITFPGKITIFKAKLKIKHFLSTPLKFKHFSRPVRTLLLSWTSVNFLGESSHWHN